MKTKIIYSYIFLFCLQFIANTVVIAQPCGSRYLDSAFSSSSMSTIMYDVQPNYLGIPIQLFADVYSPVGDTATKRAAIIHLHGGAFVSGTRDMLNIPYMCDKIAKKGYVIASIDYRIGRSDTTNYSLGQAQLRANQDLNSFIRFAKQFASVYNIDTNKIFVQGSSAGGGISLANAFLDDTELPGYIDTIGVGSLLGTGNLYPHSNSKKAIFNLWGTILDTTWIDSGDIPVGTLQSIYDPCIHWTSGPDCHLNGYNHFGSYSINQRANNLGIYSVLKGFNSNIHGLGIDSIPFTDTLISVVSTFYYNILCGQQIGFNELSNQKTNFSFYPNPANNTLNIIVPSNFENTNLHFVMYNLVGMQIRKVELNQSMEIDISNLNNGLYLIQIWSDKNLFGTEKLIIE